MKQRIFTFLLLTITALTACRKDRNEPSIKEYDDAQIQAYMSTNSLSDFKRDTTDGDTTGLYYKIINKGSGAPLEYSDFISLVYTLRSMDGKYTASDTILNHQYLLLGYVSKSLPKGLQLGIKNALKFRGASMRLLIPSRLAYGKSGFGTGSITNTNGRIAGNQSLDMYVHVINDQQVYDDLVIRNYMSANGLTGYTKAADGTYYKIITAGTSSVTLNEFSTVTCTFTANLMNGTAVNEVYKTSSGALAVSSTFPLGVINILKTSGKVGSSLSIIIPSRLGAGTQGVGVVPPNAPVRYDIQITDITNP
ncbi:hypothetical protein FPZ43_12975 [Mucilaginibacter pallidiroseus]|uniref:Peptidyl-prolyl cis-trans isomerase n=1 Tax=Mucilaginibacter pallidiroseus TaxID=2599295 RepID=A0A563U7R6_9SPHI|nr:FKBP-type peptidyl-prolyl cis-trans isomerase [Mucilaginibacter pallidiroseus]TWR27390.1 hypothetical protein FPZ43_12975 [Mucilaginibacter pallidiroseus]